MKEETLRACGDFAIERQGSPGLLHDVPQRKWAHPPTLGDQKEVACFVDPERVSVIAVMVVGPPVTRR